MKLWLSDAYKKKVTKNEPPNQVSPALPLPHYPDFGRLLDYS
jgi:hypothetical protein